MAIQDGFSPSYWRNERDTISGSSTFNSDGVELSQFKAVKYIFSAWNDTEGKNLSMEVMVNNRGSSVSDTVYTKLGDRDLGIQVGAVVNSGAMSLEVVNNETYDIIISVFRLIII